MRLSADPRCCSLLNRRVVDDELTSSTAQPPRAVKTMSKYSISPWPKRKTARQAESVNLVQPRIFGSSSGSGFISCTNARFARLFWSRGNLVRVLGLDADIDMFHSTPAQIKKAWYSFEVEEAWCACIVVFHWLERAQEFQEVSLAPWNDSHYDNNKNIKSL